MGSDVSDSSTRNSPLVIIQFMTVQTFRELLAQRPFKPFRLIMSSGQAYDIRLPEMAWLTRTSILVGIDETEDSVPSEFKICSLLHVATIEPLPSGPRQSADA
jgi:hypothetical protein